MGLNNLLFVWNIHAAFETMNISLRQTSPLFVQYLNECSEVCHNNCFIDVRFVLATSLCRKQLGLCKIIY